MSVSVIVPAYNEAAVLPATLEQLLTGLPQEARVWVAANGCTDNTVEIARSFEPRVSVVEISEASKTGALNAVEAELSPGTRVFVDADVRITGSDIGKLIASVSADGVVAAEPRVIFDATSSGFLVRSFYRVWDPLHGGRPGDVGGGVICLSWSGRQRFNEFPDVISDDGYARAHFATKEICRVDDAVSTVRAPSHLISLVRIKTRSRLGSKELRRRFPQLWESKVSSTPNLSQKLLAVPPSRWILVPIYVGIQVVVRVRAAAQERRNERSWERDDSSRR